VNSKQEGLCIAKLYLDNEPFATRYLWLNKNETVDIVFSGLKIDTAGKHKIQFGDSAKPVYLQVNREKAK